VLTWGLKPRLTEQQFLVALPLPLSGRTTDDLFFLLLLPSSIFISQLIEESGQWYLKFIQTVFPNPSGQDHLNRLIYTAALIFQIALLKSFLWAARFARLPVPPLPGPCTLPSRVFWTHSLLALDSCSHKALQNARTNTCTHTHGPFLTRKRLIRVKKILTSSSVLFFSFTSSQL